uniref:Pituitary homeobox 2 n=1 Tax=Sphaerodactylus townsendi TaxID=933632 RepID=A0ACB8E8P3_9SAUR
MESNCRKLVSACVQLGVQPSAVECLFSKESDIKKGEFNDSPESRKEGSSSKLFGRQHAGANDQATLAFTLDDSPGAANSTH